MKKLMALVLMVTAMVATVANAEMLGRIETSGFLIKDTLEVHAFDDPSVKGVTCYVTLPKRSFSIEDQTDASISCRKTGDIAGKLTSEKRIFKRSKSWFVKSLYIDRIYDKRRNVLIYVSYTSKLSGDNANNSVSVVRVR